MPLYDYACPNCEHRFELKQSFRDPVTTACPRCGAESRRVIHAPQVVYKGDGFYTSDQRRNGFGSYWYNKEAEADRGETGPENVADMANSKPENS
jgi:putative FmdB family regulatory protein